MYAASPQAWAAGGRHRLWRAPIGRHSTFIKLIFVKASLSEVSRSDKSPSLCMQRPSQPLNIFSTTHIVIMFIVFTLTNMLWLGFQWSRTDTLKKYLVLMGVLCLPLKLAMITPADTTLSKISPHGRQISIKGITRQCRKHVEFKYISELCFV